MIGRLSRQLVIGLIMVLFCLFPDGRLFAGSSEDLDAFLARVDARASEVKSFSCRFLQEKHLAIFARPVTFEGVLSVARPDRLRWEFVKPLPSVLIFDGSKGIRCSGSSAPHHFDLDGDPVMRAVAEQLWSWLDGRYIALRDQYRMELDGDDVLRLEPLAPAMARFVEEIVVTFDPQTLQPTITEIREPGGDRTILTFLDYTLNKPFPISFFSSCNGRES